MSHGSKPVPLLRLRLAIQGCNFLGFIFSLWSLLLFEDPRWIAQLTLVCVSIIINFFHILHEKYRAGRATYTGVKISDPRFIVLAAVDGLLALVFLADYLTQIFIGSGQGWGIAPYYASVMCLLLGVLHLHACLSPFYTLKTPHYLSLPGSRSPSNAASICQSCGDQIPPAMGGPWTPMPTEGRDGDYVDQDTDREASMEAAEQDRLLVADLEDTTGKGQ